MVYCNMRTCDMSHRQPMVSYSFVIITLSQLHLLDPCLDTFTYIKLKPVGIKCIHYLCSFMSVARTGLCRYYIVL